MRTFTPRERAEFHSSLDKLIAHHQGDSMLPVPETDKHTGHTSVWRSPEDYERIDASVDTPADTR